MEPGDNPWNAIHLCVISLSVAALQAAPAAVSVTAPMGAAAAAIRPPIPAYFVAPEAVPATAPAIARAVVSPMHAEGASAKGGAKSMLEGAEVSLSDHEGAQPRKRRTKPNPKSAMDA